MENNLLSLISGLSKAILKASDCDQAVKDDEHVQRRLLRKGLDVIQKFEFKKVSEETEKEIWFPEILLSDCGYELLNQGDSQASESFFNDFNKVSGLKLDNLDDVWRLLLALKRPYKKIDSIEKHQFSLSGHSHFLTAEDPYAKLPSELLKPAAIPVKQFFPCSNDGLFLDKFIDHREIADVDVGPSLQDFIDGVNLSSRFKIPCNNNIEATVPLRPDSPWSENERDILDGTSFSYDFDAEVNNKSFAERYESEVKKTQSSDIISLKNKNKVEVKRKTMKGLPLAIYIQNQKVRKMIEPNYVVLAPICVELDEFVGQIKFLLCGVNSKLFLFDEREKIFFIKSGIYVNGVTPDTLFEFSKPIIRMGTAAKRLMDTVNCRIQDETGILNVTFWGCIRHVLKRHCNAVSSIPVNTTLLSLTHAVTDLHYTITTFYDLVQSITGQIPRGRLLTHIHNFSVTVLKPCVQKELLRCLVDCSMVYLIKLIEKWIFQGMLDSCNQEDFFIQINEELSNRRARECHLSVTVDESRVPSFLCNIAARIFTCGKAVWLLKLFDPENQFNYYMESMRHPKMRICSSEEDFKELECEMIEYENRVIQICGNHVSFASFQESEFEAEEEKENLVRKMKQASTARLLEIEKERLLARQNDQRHFFEVPSKPLTAKRHLMQEEVSMKCENIIESEKIKLLQTHQSLMESAENLEKRVSWRKERFNLHDKRLGNLENVADGKNIHLDEEGNVINIDGAPVERDDDINANNTLLDENTAVDRTTIEDNDMVLLRNKRKNLMSQFSLVDEDVISDRPVLEENANVLFENENNLPSESQRNKQKCLGSAMWFKDQEVLIPKLGDLSQIIRNDLPEAENELIKMDDGTAQRSECRLTEAMKNKEKVLNSEFNIINNFINDEPVKKSQTEALINKNKMMQSDFTKELNPVDSRNIPEKPTEAALNKMKILGTEYGLPALEMKTPDVTTERYKNKMKMLNRDCESDTKKSQNTGLLTEAQQNKRKMLSTEFDIAIPSLEIKKNETSPKCSEPISSTNTSQTKASSEVFVVKTTGQENVSPCIFTWDQIADTRSNLLSDLLNDQTHGDHPDVASFTKHMQRSINVVLNIQERLIHSEILKHLLFKEHLMTHLFSLRCYFLLHDGEFARSLTYGLFQSLSQAMEPHHFFNRGTLSSILHEALSCSGLSQKSFHENLSFQILKMPHSLNLDSHDLLKPFQLSYKVGWPINVIITDSTLERYKRIFHVIVNLKRVHWTLNETFLLLKSHTKDSCFDGKLLMNSPEYTKLATFRHTMTLFIMILEEHMSGNGLPQAWDLFIKQLLNVHDLDHLYERHVAFVKDVYRRCFLVKASKDLLSYVNELIELGLRFHHLLKSSTWHLINEQHYSHPHYTTLKSIFNNFCRTTCIFTKTLRKKVSHPEMSIHQPLIELIDLKIRIYDSLQ